MTLSPDTTLCAEIALVNVVSSITIQLSCTSSYDAVPRVTGVRLKNDLSAYICEYVHTVQKFEIFESKKL
jgi:hypothetical protein